MTTVNIPVPATTRIELRDNIITVMGSEAYIPTVRDAIFAILSHAGVASGCVCFGSSQIECLDAEEAGEAMSHLEAIYGV